uniref:Uncharacterized protein n=1 Tax=Tanacetum cinerariifolium TaxID=118510 RepID=A0A6L2LPG1_TANCI|nr:hypothetical protein [Tanacetum cinerariifolium]
MHEDLVATVYPQVHESLKLTTEEQVHMENLPSSSRTLSSMKNIDDAFTFGDQFLNEKSTKYKPRKVNVETEAESMVTVPIHQASSSAPPLSTPIINLSPAKLSSPLHTTLYKALKASMDRENREEFNEEMDKSRKRHYDDQDSLIHPPKDSDQRKKKRQISDASALKQPLVQKSSAWKTSDTRKAPFSSSKQKFASPSEHPIDDIPIPDGAYHSDSEDTSVAHLAKIKTRPNWLKPLPEEEAPETPKPDWMEECHLLLTDQIDFLNPEGDKERRNALSISKLKAAYYPDFGLKELVLSLWIESEHDYGISAACGIESYQTELNLTQSRCDATNFLFKEDYTIIHKARAVIYRDSNNQKKMMRENEVYKFSDGTLMRILEKMDFMVKDYMLFKFNPGMEHRIWFEDNKWRSQEFIKFTERRLKIRRIFRSLESFVSGRFHTIGRCNNYAVLQSIPCYPECKIVGQILLEHSLSYALTTTANVPVVYLQKFWRIVSKVPSPKDTIKFMLNTQEFIYTLDMFRYILHLLVETLENLFVAPVNIETVESFMNRVGYQSVFDKEIRATDDFKEYETVFMNVDIRMNQPQSVVSTQRMHRSTPRAHRALSLTASPQGKKRNQNVRESSSPRKIHKITIKKRKQSTPSIPSLGDDRERCNN